MDEQEEVTDDDDDDDHNLPRALMNALTDSCLLGTNSHGFDRHLAARTFGGASYAPADRPDPYVEEEKEIAIGKQLLHVETNSTFSSRKHCSLVTDQRQAHLD